MVCILCTVQSDARGPISLIVTDPLAGHTKNIGKSWADGSPIIGFSFFSFGLGMTSNTELFIVNFNKSFSIIIGCGQTEFYFPTFANTGSLSANFYFAGFVFCQVHNVHHSLFGREEAV